MTEPFQKQLSNRTINPFNSKVTIPESLIFSGYFLKPSTSKTFQLKLFNYLDRPSGWKCLIYHLFIFSLVITILTISALETVRFTPLTRICLYYLEIILVIVFILEYIARVWSAGSQSSFQHFKGRLKYVSRLANIFDLLILIGSILSLTLGVSEGMITASTMKILRLIQIVRIARVDRRGATWGLLSSVIYNHHKELITALFIGFLCLLISSYLMFVAENYSKPSTQFKSLADAFYWGIITVTTVGYGDITPETWLGKTICACGAFVTISFFALPAGILGSGFALKVQQKQRQKHYNRQIPVAATLIQTLWRYNRINCTVGSNATWAYYASAVGEFRQNHLKRRRDMILQMDQKNNHHNINAISKVNTDDFSDYENYELTSSQRKQIKVLSNIRFHVARRKFQQLRNPYDVQDVIEQYSQGHFHLMLKMKDIHRKIDQTVGKINEYKIRKPTPTIIESLDILNKKMNHLENMVANIHSIITSSPNYFKKIDHSNCNNQSSNQLTGNAKNNSTPNDSSNDDSCSDINSDC